jgi:hypothetical protein
MTAPLFKTLNVRDMFTCSVTGTSQCTCILHIRNAIILELCKYGIVIKLSKLFDSVVKNQFKVVSFYKDFCCF